MISSEEVKSLIKSNNIQAESLAKRLHIAPIRFKEEILNEGISDPEEIQYFEMLKNNYEQKSQFKFKSISDFQQKYDIQDHELCLYWDIGHNVWYKMKRGEQKPTPQIRKLFKATKLLADEGYDIKRYIARA